MKRSTFSIVQNTNEIDCKTIENIRITKKDIEAALLAEFSLTPENYMLSYVDPDGDEVIAEIEEDFAIAEATAENGELKFVVGLEEHFNYQPKPAVIELKPEISQQPEVIEPSQVLEPMNKENASEQLAKQVIKIEEPQVEAVKPVQEVQVVHPKLTKEEKEAKLKEKEAAKQAKLARQKEKKEKQEEKQREKQKEKQRKKLEKQKEKKAAKAKPATQILSKDEIIALIQQQVTKMIPKIKKQLKSQSSSSSEDSSSEQQKKEERDVGKQCNTCHKKHLPYFINPTTNQVFCPKCQNLLKDEAVLIKIKSTTESENIARINYFPIYNFNLKHKQEEKIHYLTELRDLTINKVKQSYNQQINEIKEKQRLEQLAKKQENERKAEEKKKQLEIQKLNKQKARIALETAKISKQAQRLNIPVQESK